MKKLSIKEKAKAYDEVLERAKEKYSIFEGMKQGDVLEDVFPELKESEDERIRKRIIALVNAHGQGLYKDKMLAWIEEKQGKNNMSISEATKQELEDNLNKALEKETPESCNEFLEKQGEQKTADNKDYSVPLDIEIPFGAKDSELMQETIRIPDGCYAFIEGNKIVIKKGEKPAWSEDDERERKHCIDFLNHPDMIEVTPTVKKGCIDWLKSLKDRYTWKPSDVQMKYIEDFKKSMEESRSMTDKIQKIRKGIERLKSQLIKGACASQIAMGTRCKEEAYNEVLAILDSMQEEHVSESINFEQELYKAFGQVKDFTLGMRIAKWFYDMGKNSQEPVSEDLEQASKEWLKPQLDKSYADYGETNMMELTHFDGYAMLDAIEFGAKWQKKRESIPSKDLEELINSLSKRYPEVSFAKLSRIAVRVAKWQMAQMIKDATDVTVHVDAGGYPYIPQMELYDYDKDIPLAKEGDKYKVVLIKED